MISSASWLFFSLEKKLELYKNATYCFGQILEVAPEKKQLYGLFPLITQTIQVRKR